VMAAYTQATFALLFLLFGFAGKNLESENQ
jgi:hypothetical protein